MSPIPGTQLLVRTITIVLAVVGIYWTTSGAVRATTDGADLARSSSLDPTYGQQQFARLRDQFAAQVPTGSTVAIADLPDVLWAWQRLNEFAAMHGVVVISDRNRADFTVSLGPDPTNGRYLRLVTTPTR